MKESEIKTSHDELIARIIDNEDVYMYTSVLRKNEAILLANRILEVIKWMIFLIVWPNYLIILFQKVKNFYKN